MKIELHNCYHHPKIQNGSGRLSGERGCGNYINSIRSSKSLNLQEALFQEQGNPTTFVGSIILYIQELTQKRKLKEIDH